MHALDINVSQFGTSKENADHIQSALSRGLQELTPAPFAHDGTFVIVGSGCSVINYANQIREDQRQGKTICAIKGAHDWLIDNGIIPDCFVSVEPRSRVENLVNKNEQTVYLLASRVSPEVFDHLSDCKVMLWHSWSDEKECEAFKGHMAIGGGTTSGLRAVNVAYVLGYRKMKFYGMDSCLDETQTKKRFTGEGPGAVIDVICGDRTFYCTFALAQQAQDFQKLYNIMDITIESVGDGLISAIIDERKKKGLKT